MTIHFTARHFKAPDALQKFAEDSISPLAERFDGIVAVDITLDQLTHGTSKEVAEVRVSVYGDTLFAKEETMNFQTSITACIQKLERQLIKYKDRLHGPRHAGDITDASLEPI